MCLEFTEEQEMLRKMVLIRPSFPKSKIILLK